ncbi:hypothetical protein E2C01_062347 [Portunus trituberculatus]|uniref:Uncharacterized protein n=1 Tax=Portunus trituberculatus TaxID=210409 RepID=A0A5B7H7L7_PORTR|nr:hypothetical protein [Portunus trituberculatus]
MLSGTCQRSAEWRELRLVAVWLKCNPSDLSCFAEMFSQPPRWPERIEALALSVSKLNNVPDVAIPKRPLSMCPSKLSGTKGTPLCVTAFYFLVTNADARLKHLITPLTHCTLKNDR